eukprot:CAMPEP_0178931298 /NCGR_PEP_ID=MMETSP0786-20121207/21833_1 /TAXON_ID=186022 /ORGANISM="Thalassionema frauenfeldii, Strain CCMP 1798" /LENGTH=63 /DNA_ID=CAMNT_0020608161 /DNA_START=1523 /DNA_END=1711 /DNA_ORIENTATION=-
MESSNTQNDCEVEHVIEGLSVDREGESMKTVSGHAIRASMIANARAQLPASTHFYNVDEDECT